LPSLAQISPSSQSLLDKQASSAGDRAAHTPQRLPRVARAQRVLEHWASESQGWPSLRAPGASRHASGQPFSSRGPQPTLARLAEHPAKPSALVTVSRKAKLSRQVRVERATQVAWSP
jgi:hypothetical protein